MRPRADLWPLWPLWALLGAASVCHAASYDLIIRNGQVIDGTGSPWYAADVAVKDGHIAAIGRLAEASATQVIDARGKVVAPGFIDMLGQSELTLLVDPRAPSKIYQGITTEITGEGESVAPLNDAILAQNRSTYERLQLKVDWRTLQEYFARLERQRIGINFATYIGATTVREMVIGYADRAPSAAELQRMQALVEEGMRQGAVGVSSALEYPPAPYAGTEELIALARAAARYGGIYATHLRDEGDREMEALEEAFRIGREADIPVEIWHLKTSGLKNWGRMPQVIARIAGARAEGVDVGADTYAYTAWSNRMSAFTPPWANDGGKEQLLRRLRDPALRTRMRNDMTHPGFAWDDEWLEIRGGQDILVSLVTRPELRPYQGKRISEIAAAWHEDPIDTIFDLLIKDDADTEVVVFGMSEPDVALGLQQPWVAIDNDSGGTAPAGLLGSEH
ncbi:MAG: amidohydrolase family protein, partial [Gammaproteobacteria bacterium]|nr:amidohydrolase family protein [Gammaproteobacteria bacterium]